MRSKFQDNSFEILHQDESILVLNKPSGLLVHRGYGRDDITLVDLIRDYLGSSHPVHRLDRATSGVMVFAVNGDGARILQEQFQAGTVVKTYHALVRGLVATELIIDHPVPKAEGGERIDALTSIHPIEHVEVEPREVTWVEARPKTGRFHQIRRHVKHINHPIIGDSNYGKGALNREFAKRYGLSRLALHASRIEFTHPDTSERVSFTASLPEDLSDALSDMGFSFLTHD